MRVKNNSLMTTTGVPILRSDSLKNRMLPLPIPFLKMGPVMSKAKSVQMGTNVSELLPTLPPSIVVDPIVIPRLVFFFRIPKNIRKKIFFVHT